MVNTGDENATWRKKKFKIVKDPGDCFILCLLLEKIILRDFLGFNSLWKIKC